MRIALLLACVVFTVGSAQATIISSWTTEDAGNGLDRLVYAVTATAGETMAGFSISIYDPQLRGLFVTGADPILKEGKDQDTSFLLDRQHIIAGTPPTVIPDLMTYGDFESVDRLQVSQLACVRGGKYAPGWSQPLDLAEIIVPHGSITPGQLVVTQLNHTGPYALASRPDGSLMNIYPVPIPEPGTLALLATGAISLLVFGWRNRR